MNHAFLLWIATFAYAVHVLEEFTLDWKGWATAVLKLPVSWQHFAVVNGVVVVLGLSCAGVGWSLPAYSLCFPALMLINATFFHVGPFFITRGRFSPGLFTACLLFYPLSLWIYYGAWRDGVLSWQSVLASLFLAAILMAAPIVLLKIRFLPYFQQT